MNDQEIRDALKEIVLKDIDRCRQDIIDGGETMSHFIGMTGDGSMQFYLTPWQGEEDKNAIVDMIRQQFAENGTVGYALVSEVWYMALKPGEKRPPGQPSDYPHLRKEALMATITTHLGEEHASCEITREGEIKVGEPLFETIEPGSSSGRMVGLLPVRH